MTPDEALHEWFNQFGMPFYPASSVPEDCAFPWGTYELTAGSFDGGEIGLTVNLWFYTSSEAVPNAKAREISRAIGHGGVVLDCGGGYIWIKRGRPWCQSVPEQKNPNIKRRYINITVEYLMEDQED